jgi:phytanoyl-CoA hydroxylase
MIRHITDEEIQFLHLEGYVVIKGLYSPEEVQEIKREFQKVWIDLVAGKVLAQNPNLPLNSLFPPVRDQHLTHERLMALMLDPRNFALVEQVIGEEPLAVGTSCFYKAPGANVLPFHQDNYDIGAIPGTSWAVWISLDKAEAENGALRFVPGTQHFDLIAPRIPSHISNYGQAVRVPEGYGAVDVCTSPGDAVLFNGQILHGSNANKTRYRFRRAFVTHFIGSSVEKVFVHYLDLYNRHGETVKRKLNKTHKLQFEKEYAAVEKRFNRKET